MSTLAAMTANVRTDLVIDPNGDIWSDTRIQRYIQEFVGVVYTWTGLDFGETSATLTLVDGTATYDLDTLSNYGKFISIRLAGRTNLLTEKTKKELENTVDLTFEGEPLHYYFYGEDTIGLWPVPDGVIVSASVNYERSGPTLSTSDEPSFDSHWHHVCEKYAYWRCLDTQPGFDQQALKAKQNFEQSQAAMKNDLWARDTDTRTISNQIQPTWPA